MYIHFQIVLRQRFKVGLELTCSDVVCCKKPEPHGNTKWKLVMRTKFIFRASIWNQWSLITDIRKTKQFHNWMILYFLMILLKKFYIRNFLIRVNFVVEDCSTSGLTRNAHVKSNLNIQKQFMTLWLKSWMDGRIIQHMGHMLHTQIKTSMSQVSISHDDSIITLKWNIFKQVIINVTND